MGAARTEIELGPHPRLVQWLEAHGVEHDIHEHRRSVTARETARAEGIDPRRFAKCVGVITAEGRHALLVVEATDRIDLLKAREALDTDHIRLLSEAELFELAPDCEIGAIPPIGELWGLPVYADNELREDQEIAFHAGNHRFTVHVDRASWVQAAHVIYADIAESDERPAWAQA
jgi:Ala-tRNA(Pro) deacylase